MEDKQIQTSLTEKVPEWKLKLAYFYAEHKIVIKRASVFSLFFIDLIVVFLLGSILINYQTGLVADERQLEQLPVNLVNTQAIMKQKPEELIIQETVAMRTSGGKYNLMAGIKNNNPEWAIIKLDYTFVIDGRELETRSTFLLPKSEKYLMYFNAEGKEDASLKILNTQWQRLKDFSLLSYKDGIEVKQAVYKPSRSDKLSGEVEVELFNNTPYGFWEVGLPIILYNRNSEPIAINYIVINKLLAKEERKLTTSWHESITEQVREVLVYPEINLLDKSVVMPLAEPIGSPPGVD